VKRKKQGTRITEEHGKGSHMSEKRKEVGGWYEARGKGGAGKNGGCQKEGHGDTGVPPQAKKKELHLDGGKLCRGLGSEHPGKLTVL